MDYNTIIQRLDNFRGNLPCFCWPARSKNAFNEVNWSGSAHEGAIKYLLSVARSRDGRGTVSEIEMKAVNDVVKAICFVIAAGKDCLHMHGKDSLYINMDCNWDGERHDIIEHELYRKYSASFPNWMRYVDGRAEQEMFIFLFIGYYESIKNYPEYCDVSLLPYYASLVEKLCTENSFGVNHFALIEPIESLPKSLLAQQIRYFINREKTLEKELSESKAETRSLDSQLRETVYKLNECQLRQFGAPDREYVVRGNGIPYRVLVYESFGKVQKYKDVESCVCEVIAEKLGFSPEEVTPGSDLTGDLCADSLDSVELIVELERILGIGIPDEVAADIRTVGDVVTLIRANQPQDRLLDLPYDVETYDIEALDELLGESYERI